MRHTFFSIFLLLAFIVQAQLYRPSKDLKELFKAVQLSEVFPDSKTFPDAIPQKEPARILEHYRKKKDQPGFDLEQFVRVNFELPARAGAAAQINRKPIEEHLDSLWAELVREDRPSRSSLIEMPYPYVVPGGRFNEMYYWDSYFTMLGLRVAGKKDLIRNMISNFAWMIDSFGLIPNGTRTYYLSRSQPPFFALMVDLLAEMDGPEIYRKYLPQLQAEYDFWMQGADKLGPETGHFRNVVLMPDGSILNRYWDEKAEPRPESFREDLETAERSLRADSVVYRNIRAACESGWDFSSRWLADGLTLSTIHTTEIIPIDLNALLYHLERTLGGIYRQTGARVPAREFELRAGRRRKALQYYCRDRQAGFYRDYDFVKKEHTPVFSLAALYPLFFKMADSLQAEKVAEKVRDHFLFPGGVVTTLSFTGQQWDAPNGWAPLQWITYVGLKNYGFSDLAETIRVNWMKAVEKEFSQSGRMMEKYNVIDLSAQGGGGEYPSQDGFGWTNGVYLKMLHPD